MLTLRNSSRPASRKKRDDQQAGHQPDEEIRENQLAADAPQQPALGPDDAAREAVAGDEDEREAADRVDGSRTAAAAGDDQADERGDGLDREAAERAGAPAGCGAASAATDVRPSTVRHRAGADGSSSVMIAQKEHPQITRMTQIKKYPQITRITQIFHNRDHGTIGLGANLASFPTLRFSSLSVLPLQKSAYSA